MIKASKRSLMVGHPLIDFFDQLPRVQCHQISPINLLSGLASSYKPQMAISQQAIDIMKNQCLNPNNHGYSASSGIQTLKTQIVKLCGRGHLSTKDVIVTSGVHICLFFTLISTCKQKDYIAVPNIGYPFFQKLAPAMGINICIYELNKEKNFQVDLDSLYNVVSKNKAKLIFVINPSNPTGNCFSKTHLKQIYKMSQKLGALILADQVYFGQANQQITSFADVYQEYPIITTTGAQKLFQVPGWCVSWILIFDKNKIIQKIYQGISNAGMLFLHPNLFIQNGLAKILPLIGTSMAERVKQFQTQAFFSQLNEVRGLKVLPRQGTYYAAVEVNLKEYPECKNDKDYTFQILKCKNISALPLSIMGDLCGFRLPITLNEQNRKQLVKRLKQFSQK